MRSSAVENACESTDVVERSIGLTGGVSGAVAPDGGDDSGGVSDRGGGGWVDAASGVGIGSGRLGPVKEALVGSCRMCVRARLGRPLRRSSAAAVDAGSRPGR